MCWNFGFCDADSLEQISSLSSPVYIYLLNRNPSLSLLCNHLFKSACCTRIDLVSESVWGAGFKLDPGPLFQRRLCVIRGRGPSPGTKLAWTGSFGCWEGVLSVVLSRATVSVGFVSVSRALSLLSAWKPEENKLFSSSSYKKSHKFGMLMRGKHHFSQHIW